VKSILGDPGPLSDPVGTVRRAGKTVGVPETAYPIVDRGTLGARCGPCWSSLLSGGADARAVEHLKVPAEYRVELGMLQQTHHLCRRCAVRLALRVLELECL
jgi:hypothetical protein